MVNKMILVDYQLLVFWNCRAGFLSLCLDGLGQRRTKNGLLVLDLVIQVHKAGKPGRLK